MTKNSNISHIDFDALREIKELFGADYDSEFAMFLKNTQLYLEEIRAAIITGNRAEADSIAHKLASSAGQYGVIRLFTLARRFERERNKTCFKNAGAAVEEMQEEFDKYKDFFS